MINGREKMLSEIADEVVLLDDLINQETANIEEKQACLKTAADMLKDAKDRQNRFEHRYDACIRLRESLEHFGEALEDIGAR